MLRSGHTPVLDHLVEQRGRDAHVSGAFLPREAARGKGQREDVFPLILAPSLNRFLIHEIVTGGGKPWAPLSPSPAKNP